MTEDSLDELASKLEEIKRLVKNAREKGGAHKSGFILGLDAGMLLGKIEAELKRRKKT